jgi:CRISPR system Cascade subunit CasB
LAILRRNAGHTIAESRGAIGLFYRILPRQMAGSREEEIFFLIASLYGLNAYAHKGDFGSTYSLVRRISGSESIDRRFTILLDSEFDVIDGIRPGGGELAFRLRQAVKLAAGKSVGVDWPRLLADLTKWNEPWRAIRKQWARSYFGQNSQNGEDSGRGA